MAFMSSIDRGVEFRGIRRLPESRAWCLMSENESYLGLVISHASISELVKTIYDNSKLYIEEEKVVSVLNLTSLFTWKFCCYVFWDCRFLDKFWLFEVVLVQARFKRQWRESGFATARQPACNNYSCSTKLRPCMVQKLEVDFYFYKRNSSCAIGHFDRS